MVIGLAVGLLIAPFLVRKFKGMSFSEIVSYIFELLGEAIGYVVKLVSKLIQMVLSGKNKALPEK